MMTLRVQVRSKKYEGRSAVAAQAPRREEDNRAEARPNFLLLTPSFLLPIAAPAATFLLASAAARRVCQCLAISLLVCQCLANTACTSYRAAMREMGFASRAAIETTEGFATLPEVGP